MRRSDRDVGDGRDLAPQEAGQRHRHRIGTGRRYEVSAVENRERPVELQLNCQAFELVRRVAATERRRLAGREGVDLMALNCSKLEVGHSLAWSRADA